MPSYTERVTGSGSSGNSNSSSDSENSGVVNVTDTASDGSEEPIENKWNDLTGMFETEDTEMRMNDDTPSVEIYISHEKVWEVDEEGELGDAISLTEMMEKAYEESKEEEKKNTKVVKENGTTVVATKAIDDTKTNSTNNN